MKYLLITIMLMSVWADLLGAQEPDLVTQVENAGETGVVWLEAVTTALQFLGPIWSGVIAFVAVSLGWFLRFREAWKAKDFQFMADHKSQALVEVSEEFSKVRTFAENMVGALEDFKDRDVRCEQLAENLIQEINMQSITDGTEGVAQPLVHRVKSQRKVGLGEK